MAQATKQKKVTLDDLSPADRRRLAAEIATGEETSSSIDDREQERQAAARRERLRTMIDDRDHLRGCPNNGRVEAYAQRTPTRSDAAGTVIEPPRDVTVVRCLECGGTTLIDRPYTALVAELDGPDHHDEEAT